MQRLSRLSTRARGTWLADADLKAKQRNHGGNAGTLGMLSLAWASIGVIYGDLGTSPLYVYSTIFTSQPSQQDVLCAASLVFWSITLVVMVKYVFIMLLADDNGQGGTFALYATVCRACGIPAINSGAMPADRQLFDALSNQGSLAGSPASSMRHVKVSRVTAQHSSKALQGGAAVGAGGGKGQPETQDTDAQDGGMQVPPQHAQQQQGPKNVVGAYLHRTLSHSRLAQKVLLGITLLMTAMVLGDGVLTPAISVLAAVSGLEVNAGLSAAAVTGITCAILVGIFAMQSLGTQRVGVLFAPTVAAFMLSNVAVGIYNIATFEGGAVFRALSPHYIVLWFQRHGSEGWMNLAGVFLCLTGCEALFADLGHFSRPSIQFSFATMVYPSLIITYLGQASWLLHHPEGYATVFYSSLPQPVFWPLFVVSVLASIVASQALITGAFSIVHQSMAMGCFPRFRIHHTSDTVGGQIYIPEVNYALLVLCVAVVAGFQSSSAIANAYGIAVNLVMLSSVFLVSLVMLVDPAWDTHPLLVAAFFLPFALIEGVFLSANILNIPHGGWFSITLAVALSALNVLWIWGTSEKTHAYRREQFQLSDLLTTKPPGSWQGGGLGGSQGWRLFRVSNLAPVHRNPGMALVYSESPLQVPAVFRRLVESWGVHSIVVFLTVRQVPLPHVALPDRLLLAPMEFRGFYKCVARYGYMDKVDQGEAFAQSILDKIADTMPTHALMDNLGAAAPHHRGASAACPAGPDCPPPAPPPACIPAHDGMLLARAAAALLPPAIAKETASAQSSCYGGGGGGKPASGGGAQAEGAAAGVVRVAVLCSSRMGSLDGLQLPGHEDAEPGAAAAAAAGGGGGGGGGGDGGASAALDPDLSHATPAAGSEPQGPAAAPAAGAAAPALASSPAAAAVAGTLQGQGQARGGGVGGLGAVPHNRRTTWEAYRARNGPAAVSDLAARAVYVLHRSILHVRPAGNRFSDKLRRVLLEHVYQQLWHMTQRFWEGWKVPAARLFEVGMVIEL